jgi:hypothetical protein
MLPLRLAASGRGVEIVTNECLIFLLDMDAISEHKQKAEASS